MERSDSTIPIPLCKGGGEGKQVFVAEGGAAEAGEIAVEEFVGDSCDDGSQGTEAAAVTAWPSQAGGNGCALEEFCVEQLAPGPPLPRMRPCRTTTEKNQKSALTPAPARRESLEMDQTRKQFLPESRSVQKAIFYQEYIEV